ncbi:hypothetical protein LLH00_04135 [bacterium]|nr:hypothetical protein [bacterium]
MSFSRRAFLRSFSGLLVPALFPAYAAGLAKSDPEIFVQYVQGRKERLIRVPLGSDLQVSGLVTGIVVNRADTANLSLLPDMKRLIPFDHPEWSQDNELLLRSGIYQFDIHRAGLDNIGHVISPKSLTQGTFFSFYREPVTYKDFFISVDDTRLSIDHQNPVPLVKNIMYIGNKADKFYTERKEYLEVLLKREQELSAFPNHNLPIIFNRFGVGAASLTREAIWIMPECHKKHLVPVYEHEQLHDITETTGLVGDLELIDYFVSLIEEIPEVNRQLLRRTLMENQGLSPYKILRVGNRMQIFEFIDEKQYLEVPIETHPEHDVSEFATSYSHTLIYPEITLQRLKDARQEIRLSYVEAGDRMLGILRRDPQRAGGFLEFFGETFHWIKGRVLA